MAKKSAVEKNNRRMRKVAARGARRDALRAMARDKNLSLEERFAASCKLAQEPRDSARIRVRNRCWATGKPRGVYRDFGLCRNQLRERAHKGELPGVVKSSW